MSSTDLTMSAKSPTKTTRSHSISSDRTSLTGYGGLMSPPLSARPEPAFIAASAASQIVTNDHDSRADTWMDQHGIEPSGETALVPPQTLKLVNGFLDQLLFNFLSVAKSTSLASLRPAVTEVLKTRLAHGAVQGADQELQEYLGGGDDEELMAFHNGVEPSGKWDLELVWKRTRLRCMVYSSLGDMEEEDEDYYTMQEQLDGPPGSSNRFSNNPGVVSPAVAIFLTSILEYMGEQVLMVAGQSAYNRLRARHEKDERDGTSTHGDIAARVVVEEFDMERVAMDRTLGRLWRGWKKRIRSPPASISLPRSLSREASSPVQGKHESHATEEAETRRPSLAAVLAEFDHAVALPLPISPNDIREIEIPGLASHSDDEGEADISEDEGIEVKQRPMSLLFFKSDEDLDLSSTDQPPAFLSPRSRLRSNSLPSPAALPYRSQRTESTIGTEDEANSNASLNGHDQAEDATSSTPGAHNPTDEISVTKEKSDNYKGLISEVVAGATSIGAIAVAGIVAAAHGEAPQTDPFDDEDEPDMEEMIEEPQIMTSSRISIGGRISPDTGIPSRHSSLRSHSVHSLRLIDVASPKSPNRSRHGSVDASDYVSGRPISLIRASSLSSPLDQNPRVASPISRGPTSSPIIRNGSSMSTRQLRHGTEGSITEEKEVNTHQQTPPADTAEARQGVAVYTPQKVHELPAEVIHYEPSSKTPPFTLSAAPVPRNLQEVTNRTAGSRPMQPPAILTNNEMDLENGVSPLTYPKRRSMDRGHDNSNAIPRSVNSSVRDAKETKPVAKHSSISSGSPMDHQKPSRNQPSLVAPTSPLRSSPPRRSRDDQSMKSMAEPLSKQKSRQGSGSQSSGNSHKLKPVRASGESSRHPIDDKGQSFEQLIRSDQTIQYTLTPQNMRNIESPDSLRHTQATNGYDPRVSSSGRSNSSSINKSLPIQSNVPVELPRSPKTTTFYKPPSRSSSNMGSKVRGNAPQARDARVDRDSLGDFAEFIRSTGPANEYDPASARSNRGTNGSARTVSGSTPRSTEANNVPRRAESSAGRSRLLARDATVSRGDSISDLIDFVRSGPQLEKDNHRIPRTVAPFRSTMDSDQMSGAVGGKAIDATLPDPRFSQAISVDSSVNSQSALLSNSSKAKSNSTSHQNEFEEQDMMPKRKIRRVRDPYAIDLSDEDEEEYHASSRPKPIQEESLADFLKNVPPPPDSAATPIFEPTRPSSKHLKNKSSTPSFRSRFSRKEPTNQAPSKAVPHVSDTRTSGSRNGERKFPTHTPIAAQYSTTLPSYEPTRGGSNYVSQVDSARNKVVQKSYQPREAVYSPARTNDLADFLKQSEPSQEQAQPLPLALGTPKEEGTFQRMFGRRRVH